MPSARAEEENRLVRLAVRCASARQLDQLHARAVLLGHARSSFVAAKLVHAFAGLGSLRRARAVAVALGAAANAFVWTAPVRAHSKSGAAARDAVVLYAQMHRSCPGVAPLTFTASAALKAAACSNLRTMRRRSTSRCALLLHVFRLPRPRWPQTNSTAEASPPTTC